MKSLKPMLFRYLLLFLILSIATPTIAVADEGWREAIGKDYRKVLKEKKPDKQIKKHRDLVNKWKETGHLEALISLYEADAETERANAGLHYGLGYAYANQGRIDTTQTAALFEKAANQFERTISLDPTLSQAYFSLGAIYQEQSKLELAAQAMKACLKLNPKYYPASYRLGEIQLQQDNPAAALESFQAAQKMNSKWARPYYGIGSAHSKLGNDNAARAALEEAIDRDPKFAPAYFKLGQALRKQASSTKHGGHIRQDTNTSLTPQRICMNSGRFSSKQGTKRVQSIYFGALSTAQTQHTPPCSSNLVNSITPPATTQPRFSTISRRLKQMPRSKTTLWNS